MTYDEVEAILSQVLDKEWEVFDSPSTRDWEALEYKFNCKFSDDFKIFITLMSKYVLPGILNVSTGENNGNDLIGFVYDYEIKNGNWDANLIPFLDVGNGDYFCLSAKECPKSPVYYYYSDNFDVEEYNKNFEEWIKKLPQFLDV